MSIEAPIKITADRSDEYEINLTVGGKTLKIAVMSEQGSEQKIEDFLKAIRADVESEASKHVMAGEQPPVSSEEAGLTPSGEGAGGPSSPDRSSFGVTSTPPGEVAQARASREREELGLDKSGATALKRDSAEQRTGPVLYTGSASATSEQPPKNDIRPFPQDKVRPLSGAAPAEVPAKSTESPSAPTALTPEQAAYQKRYKELKAAGVADPARRIALEVLIGGGIAAGTATAIEVGTGGALSKLLGGWIKSLNKAASVDASATRAPASATATARPTGTPRPSETPRPSATATETDSPTDTPKPRATEKPNGIDSTVAENAPQIDGAKVVMAAELSYRPGTNTMMYDGGVKIGRLKSVEVGKRMLVDTPLGQSFFGPLVDFIQENADADGMVEVDRFMGVEGVRKLDAKNLIFVVRQGSPDGGLNGAKFGDGQDNNAAARRSGGKLPAPGVGYADGTPYHTTFEFKPTPEGQVIMYIDYAYDGISGVDKNYISRDLNLYMSDAAHMLGMMFKNRGNIPADLFKTTVYMDEGNGYNNNDLPVNYNALWATSGPGDITP